MYFQWRSIYYWGEISLNYLLLNMQKVKDSWRVVNHRDIIPTVPRLMGYCHVAQPVYLVAGDFKEALVGIMFKPQHVDNCCCSFSIKYWNLYCGLFHVSFWLTSTVLFMSFGDKLLLWETYERLVDVGLEWIICSSVQPGFLRGITDCIWLLQLAEAYI